MTAISKTIRGQTVHGVTLVLSMLAAFAGPLGRNEAVAEPLIWSDDVGPCYDRGVYDRTPIVMLFYDKVTSRVDADTVATRMSLSPRMQAVASKATWCLADVSSGLISRNLANALKIDKYPAVSVLAPDGNMLDESVRVHDLGARVDTSGYVEAAENAIILHIESLAAKYGTKR